MGLPIENLHSPSTRHERHDIEGNEVATLEGLITQKQELEEELDALADVLKSHGVTMNTGLTTFDGFPRADIDVAQIRTTRSRIIYLRNDHKALMSKIEAGLHTHFATNTAAPRTSPLAAGHGALFQGRSQATASSTPAFARVNSVVPRSPAESAGLLAGDRIQSFGDANWLNHEKLSKVAQIVAQSEGVRASPHETDDYLSIEQRSVPVSVLRRAAMTDSWNEHQLTLIPRSNWGGRGLLGCHLLPD